MGANDQQSFFIPADTRVQTQTGSPMANFLAGLELFASLDMDALIGNAAVAASEPPAVLTRQQSETVTHFGQGTIPTNPSTGPPAWTEAMPHQGPVQPSHVSSFMPHPQPEVQPAQTTFNLVVSQGPAINMTRGGLPYLTLGRQPDMGPVRDWTAFVAPVTDHREPPFSSMKDVLSPAFSGGSEASARSCPAAKQALARRNIKAAVPEAKAQKEADARARNARNQQLHRQRQKDRLGKLEDISSNLKAKIECLTIENAGLRAHNKVLLDAVSASTHPDQGNAEGVWHTGHPEIRPQHTAMHEKLAAVFSCISTGCGRQAVSSDDVAHMSAEEIFSFRQQYGNRMRQLLQAGAESAAHALHAELLKLIALWNESEAYLWEHCPKTVHRFAAFAQRLDDQKGINVALKWQDILNCLQLDARQVRALKAMHTCLTDQLLNVTAERLHISNMLKGTLPEGSNKWEGSRTFLNVHAGHSRLAASVAHEHSIMCAAHASFRQVVSPVQQARLDVLAHPGHFDIITLLHQLATQPNSGHFSVSIPV